MLYNEKPAAFQRAHVNVHCSNLLSHKNLGYSLTAAVVFIPDSEAQRRSLQCKRSGFHYSYICVYHRSWAPTEPPRQCGAKFRSETIKDKRLKRNVTLKTLNFLFKVGAAEFYTRCVKFTGFLLTNALRNYAPYVEKLTYHLSCSTAGSSHE